MNSFVIKEGACPENFELVERSLLTDCRSGQLGCSHVAALSALLLDIFAVAIIVSVSSFLPRLTLLKSELRM